MYVFLLLHFDCFSLSILETNLVPTIFFVAENLLIIMDYAAAVVRVHCSLLSSNVLVDSAFFNRLIAPRLSEKRSKFVALEIVSQKKTFFVGCEERNLPDGLTCCIVFPSYFANYCGVDDNDTIQFRVLQNLPSATKVFVSPESVDECEVVEKNALTLEECLHLQLFVVVSGMPVKLFFNGMTARLKINEIEWGEGIPLTSGGATLGSGAQVVVAGMQRQVRKDPSEDSNPPQWATLRSIPLRNSGSESSSLIIELEPETASKWHWKEGNMLDAVDLSSLINLKEPKVDLDFLCRNQVSLKIVFSKDVPAGCCYSSFPTPTNVWLSPHTKDSLCSTSPDFFLSQKHGKGKPQPSWKDICDVHGNVPQTLLHSLRFAFQSQGQISNGNVLVCGGKGYGKSTVVAVTLQQLYDIHVVKIDCTAKKEFLEALKKGMQEAILCAPSVVFLDNFDTIAPSQKEGNVTAMSDGTKAILQAMVSYFSHSLSLVQNGMICVVATCLSRDSLHERFRSAALFPGSFVINPLTRVTRSNLLKQCIPSASKEDISKMACFMENYTSFDISHFSTRLLNSRNSKETLVEQAQIIAGSFTPLAHSGISFLKGKKVSWESIGGLQEAKKVLYETLVLPIQHSAIFSKLPLKTRSGILLYGPSGCGKTFILESLVNAENLNCLVVNGPEVFGKYIGESEQKIRDVFERAQAASPCIVFFDEFDSVAPQRGLDNSGVTDRVVNQLLCYLDGVEGRKDVFVVAASSRPDLIDAALLRPGRLDVAVGCPIPSSSDRQEILGSLLQSLPTTVTKEDIQELVNLTPNWTPADLAAMVSTANTMACQKIFSSLPSGGAFTSSTCTDNAYIIADISASHTLDATKDSLKIFTTENTKKSEVFDTMEVTMDDFRTALQTTRPSLSDKDIINFTKIDALFRKGKSIVPKGPSSKLTTQ